ncbi:hypothetical protein ACQP3L_39525, partial [Escherichia coli]
CINIKPDSLSFTSPLLFKVSPDTDYPFSNPVTLRKLIEERQLKFKRTKSFSSYLMLLLYFFLSFASC